VEDLKESLQLLEDQKSKQLDDFGEKKDNSLDKLWER